MLSRLAAAAEGEVTIEKTAVVVNLPILTWPGGSRLYLAGRGQFSNRTVFLPVNQVELAQRVVVGVSGH